ncbi:A-kinase anchor protein 8-like isoform X1 [Tachyglossus aculeatus]|uniref:A-kinase anchor protein 8-like isoform X1 n=1 Tax=Tachyglossus aculeatus TaxID=9261 RepID=UPI0018F2E439|nr:A-kinase anchor protein 8-like isoform X1 [Tachyglossus aculeatus]
MSYTGFVQGTETTLQSTFSDTTQPTSDYGYENYSYGYGYSQDNTSNYGYNMATSNSWEIPSTNTNANPSASTSSSTDTVLSKINQSLDMVTQRLDMVSHLEMDMMQGGLYGSGGDRFDSYDAYDSRATLNDRDIYRFDYDYSEIDPEMEMAYESHYDAYREQFQIRDSFGQRAQGWARDGRTNRSIAASYGRMWDDPMAARSHCGPGSSRLPSLFSQKIIPEYGMLQSMRGAYGNMRFGFGFGSGLKQMRRTWKTWGNADFKPQKKKNKKRKQSNSTDEPDSKAAKTDGSDNSDSENDEGTEGEGTETVEASEKVEKSSKEGEDDEGKDDGKEDGKPDPEKGTLTIQEEISQIKRKLQAGKKTQERQKKRQRDRMVESSGPDTAWHLCPEAPALRALCMPRGPPHWCLPPPQVLALAGSSSAKSAPGPWALQTKLFPWPSYGWQRIQFVCSLCKYRTFYEDEMTNHLDSKFHKEHFKFVGTKLPKQTADFLEEYVTNKTKKTEDRRKAIENLNGVIQQIYKDQDLTQEIGMEHFVKKVEAAHCAACDLFIPMQFGIIQKHLKTMEHNRNRRLMMDQSKKSSLVVARSILNNKLISMKLERYLKGENPFTDDPEEEKEQEDVDGGEGQLSRNLEERASIAMEENKNKEENDIFGVVNPQTRMPSEREGRSGTRELVMETTILPEGSNGKQSDLDMPPEEEPVPLLGHVHQQIRGIPGLDMDADD